VEEGGGVDFGAGVEGNGEFGGYLACAGGGGFEKAVGAGGVEDWGIKVSKIALRMVCLIEAYLRHRR
jgi:hypothetical protein